MEKVEEEIVNTPKEEIVKGTVQSPKGRAGVLAKFKKANPNHEGDPTEDDLWGFAGDDYDSIKGAHNKNLEVQKSFAEFLAKNPRFGGIVEMSHGEGEDKVPVGRAIGRMYGDVLQEDNDFWEGVKEYESSQAKSREEQKEAQNNFAESLKRFDKFATSNNLSEDQKQDVYDGLMQLADSLLMGDIPDGVFDLVFKGLNYDTDVQEAATTGEIEGQNKKIRAVMQKRTPQDGVVDMGAGTGAMGKKERIIPEEKPQGFVNQLKDVE